MDSYLILLEWQCTLPAPKLYTKDYVRLNRVEALRLANRAFHVVDVLIRYSSVFGLSTLLAKISGQDSDLFAAIAQHAGTLEGLEIIRHMADIGICGIFQVVADCRP
ncbi:hypothetical protein BGZ90_009636 [Linnemannia elongata]|nr:hypothetical protein BGZ90_009636 [Linnemannia elongata]